MSKPPFEERAHTDVPGLVGTQWWQEGVVMSYEDLARRKMLLSLAYGSVAVIGAGLAVRACNNAEGREEKAAIELQKTYGWSFGANGEALTFSYATDAPFDRAKLAQMVTEMRPTQANLNPYFVPTLFMSLTPGTQSKDPTAPPAAKPLHDVIVPINTPMMKSAFDCGQSFVDSLGSSAEKLALIVDLPGPESVAFVASALSKLDPVFVFDNWPHPRGVVSSHLTLAAVAHYQYLLADQTLRGKVPCFVMDRQRLSPYSDEAKQFDNRYAAKLPTAAQLLALGVTRVLYLGPMGVDADDVNATLAEYNGLYLPTRLVGLGDYPAGQKSALPHAVAQKDDPRWSARRPVLRATPYADTSGRKVIPEGFGIVPIIIAGGLIAGPMFARDAWSRSHGTPGS